MWLNDFSLTVPQGTETGSYVRMRHGTQYTIRLRNNRNEPCEATVEVDGKSIGTWRLQGKEKLVIEHPANDQGRLTFYRVGSSEAGASGLVPGDPNLGLVKVTFTPQRPQPVMTVYCPTVEHHHHHHYPNVHWTYTSTTTPKAQFIGASNATTEYCYNVNTVSADASALRGVVGDAHAGGTGLSGKSDQEFQEVGPLKDLDYTQQTIIMLRLIEADSTGPRPLVSTNSTPYPPPVMG